MGSWSEQRAPGKFSAFVSKYRKMNQQPTAPRKAKYLQTRGWKAASTGLHCPPSVLQVAAFLCSICKPPWAMWAHTAHPLCCKRKLPPSLPKGRNIKGTSVRSNPAPTEATTNSSARAGSRTGSVWSFYLFLNLPPSAFKFNENFSEECFDTRAKIKSGDMWTSYSSLEKAGKESGGVNCENLWKWWGGSCTDLSLLSSPGSGMTLPIAQVFVELENTNFVFSSASPSFSKAWINWVNTTKLKKSIEHFWVSKKRER